MKTINDIFTAFVRRTTLCFSLLVLTFTAIGSLTKMEQYLKGLAISELVSFFYFSCLLAVSFGIADFVKNNVIIKRTVQFVLSYISVFVVFLRGDIFNNMLANVQNPAFSYLSVSFSFVIIYAIIGLISLISKFVMNKIINSKKEYSPMFDTDKK